MANTIFATLLEEKVNEFIKLFSSDSEKLFFDENGELYHPGEFGMYRESLCKELLKFIIPSRLEIGQGFLINTNNKHSHQCDIVIYDSMATPLIESNDRQRFFPVETVVAIGEVKSTLSKAQFKDAINKMSKVKVMREEIAHPYVIKSVCTGKYNPAITPFDQIFTFLICKKMDFKMDDITSEINNLYDASIEYRHRHNMILSIEDGILLYHDGKGGTCWYPSAGNTQYKNAFMQPVNNNNTHFDLFTTCLFGATTSGTILYPEITDYIVKKKSTWINEK